jgi:hypothetical protein
VFADLGNGMVRIGHIAVAGSSTHTVIFNMDHAPRKVARQVYKDSRAPNVPPPDPAAGEEN